MWVPTLQLCLNNLSCISVLGKETWRYGLCENVFGGVLVNLRIGMLGRHLGEEFGQEAVWWKMRLMHLLFKTLRERD